MKAHNLTDISFMDNVASLSRLHQLLHFRDPYPTLSIRNYRKNNAVLNIRIDKT